MSIYGKSCLFFCFLGKTFKTGDGAKEQIADLFSLFTMCRGRRICQATEFGEKKSMTVGEWERRKQNE